MLLSLSDKVISLFLTSESLEKPIVKNENTAVVKTSDTISKNQNKLDATAPKREVSNALRSRTPNMGNNKATPAPTQQLSQDVKKESENPRTENDNASAKLWFWILIALVAIFLWITYNRYSKKCDKCGKWNSMKTVEKEPVEKIKSHIIKKLYDRDSQGKILREKPISVPATITKYHIHRKCKHCGHRDYLVKEEKKEN
jgi:ribosomal protein L37E